MRKATAEKFGEDGSLHAGHQGLIDTEGLLTNEDRIEAKPQMKGLRLPQLSWRTSAGPSKGRGLWDPGWVRH